MTPMICDLPMCCLPGDAALTNGQLSIRQTPWRVADDGSSDGYHERPGDYASNRTSVEQGAGLTHQSEGPVLRARGRTCGYAWGW